MREGEGVVLIELVILLLLVGIVVWAIRPPRR
jgi:hypothetical protein